MAYSGLLDQHGNKMHSVHPSREVVRIREEIKYRLRSGQYDAAQTTMQNEQHWIPANQLSPDAVNNLSTRKKLRSRSRYESSNSGYLKGIGLSLCQDFVGSGPTLQITDSRFQSKDPNKLSAAVIVERTWKIRSKKIKLRKKLWRLRHAKLFDGEGFSFAVNNAQLNHKVTLDQRIFECDQISSFDNQTMTKKRNRLEIDGVRFNATSGEPTHYHLLNEHPGETQFFNTKSIVSEGKWIREKNVIHWFRQDRGWLRGIPETTYTLPLWALLRRYTLAVVQNAEIAADFTVLLKTMQLPFATAFGDTESESNSDKEKWFEGFPVDRGMLTAVPDGYDVQQLKAEQPVTVYDSFVAALVGEASRPLLTPRNVAMADSGNHNMSAGLHDTQSYKQSLKQEQLDCEDEVLDKDLAQWWFEAIRTPDYFPDDVLDIDNKRKLDVSVEQIVSRFSDLQDDPPEHVYRWDEIPEHTDPAKVATAINILHMGGHITDVDIQEQRFNRSVEEHHENRRRELSRGQELRKEFPEQFEDLNPEPASTSDDDDEGS